MVVGIDNVCYTLVRYHFGVYVGKKKLRGHLNLCDENQNIIFKI